MLSKLAIFRYDPLLVLQHVHDYLQCQHRYNMSVLPRMKLKYKIADNWLLSSAKTKTNGFNTSHLKFPFNYFMAILALLV